jgi:outer membrane protein OmpA-like peptidoglycan-associated protein
VSIGTDSYGADSMTVLTVWKSATKGRYGAKTSDDGRIMIFESANRLLGPALIAGSVALSIGTSVAHTQELAMGGHFIVESATPGNVMPERIVLHGVHFQDRSDKIDNSSVAILDCAARTLEENPRSIVCIAIPPARPMTERHQTQQDELTNRREQVVVGYLEQKGVDSKRLVFVFPAVA